MQYNVFFARPLTKDINLTSYYDLLNRSISYIDISNKKITNGYNRFIDSELFKADIVICYASLCKINDITINYAIEMAKFYLKPIVYIKDVDYNLNIDYDNIFICEPYSDDLINACHLCMYK